MTSPLGATTSTSSTPGASSSAALPGGQLGKDAFLQLLVAQMKYQDPSKPTDSQAYMTQLAQFTQVEKLDALVSAQADLARWQRTVAGQSMLGQTVTGTGPDGSTVTGTVTSVSLTGDPRVQLAGGGSLAVADVSSVGDPAPKTS